jgi:hypothetical protein
MFYTALSCAICCPQISVYELVNCRSHNIPQYPLYYSWHGSITLTIHIYYCIYETLSLAPLYKEASVKILTHDRGGGPGALVFIFLTPLRKTVLE